jgi:hypothetical protein
MLSDAAALALRGRFDVCIPHYKAYQNQLNWNTISGTGGCERYNQILIMK